MKEEVNHPKHYNEHPSGVECIVIAEGFNFNVGNAIKYLWRAGLKSESPIKDLEKAIWYCQRELERMKKNEARILSAEIIIFQELNNTAELTTLRTALAERDARIAELEAFIRSEEYQHEYTNDEWVCLTCRREQNENHKEDCELFNLLQKAEQK